MQDVAAAGSAPLEAERAPAARVPILSVPVDRLDMQETLDRICEMVEIGRAAGKSF